MELKFSEFKKTVEAAVEQKVSVLLQTVGGRLFIYANILLYTVLGLLLLLRLFGLV